MNNEINAQSMAQSVVKTCLAARSRVESGDIDDLAEIVNDFLFVLMDSGLIQIDMDEMNDVEKMERGMFAANLFMSACAKIGLLESERLAKADALERTFEIS